MLCKYKETFSVSLVTYVRRQHSKVNSAETVHSRDLYPVRFLIRMS